jgi:hypothetical protein
MRQSVATSIVLQIHDLHFHYEYIARVINTVDSLSLIGFIIIHDKAHLHVRMLVCSTCSLLLLTDPDRPLLPC